ncbi:hypothetical protein PVAP13_5NG274580 [Panicum virgatum]|uniref:Uncharacterized protein n=1 Tax=Panicum virgatum TaxID=38727 RepID=A0A8T0S177_PANVG|nr:hypothetical protein PVAP13_5NG274580 [Panicum virgatum]
MGDVAARQFDCLMLNGKNYQTWVVDCQFHLAAMQLTHTITPRADAALAVPEHEIAKASIFLRHHIHKDLKQEYLEARRDWGQLRFLDFKSVEAYNSALHRIVGQLRFWPCLRVTDAEMIEKTLEIFHPSNMVLQQQYRNNRHRKYSKLINVLLAAETQNELLMKNFNMRPVGSNALPEAHASFQKKPKTFFKKGSYSRSKDTKKGSSRSNSTKKIEYASTAMDVDPKDASALATQDGDDDYNLDEEDTLEDDFGDME